MTTILNELRASGGDDVIIPVIEIRLPVGGDRLFLCGAYRDYKITLESGEQVIAIGTGMQVALPKKDATGAQNLKFALDNVRRESSEFIKAAISSAQDISLIFREYVSSNLSEPAENPMHMTIREYTTKGTMISVTAGFFDIIDTEFPRRRYNDKFSPALKYHT